MDVVGLDLFHPDAISRLEDMAQAIRCGFIGAHQAKIAILGVSTAQRRINRSPSIQLWNIFRQSFESEYEEHN
jgi:hypothetical protein